MVILKEDAASRVDRSFGVYVSLDFAHIHVTSMNRISRDSVIVLNERIEDIAENLEKNFQIIF